MSDPRVGDDREARGPPPRADGGFDADRRGDDESVDAAGPPPAGPPEEPSRTDAEGNATEPQEAGTSEAELRRRVEEKYDFENFGPRQMTEMTAEEWEVAFDPDTWITGEGLLKRVEAELKNQIARREVFAVPEYATLEGERVLVAYSDQDYAIVYPDGSVEGVGTVLRDVKPTVALCSMEEYEVEEPPDNWRLPPPETVPEAGSQLGHWMIQALAAVQLLVGVGALLAWPILGARDNLILLVTGLGFCLIGLVLFVMVANARLAERYRLDEYRDRLRTVGADSDGRPSFLPIDDDAFEGVEGAPGRESRE